MVLDINYDPQEFMDAEWELGACGQRKFYCAGFVHFILKRAGISLPENPLEWKPFFEHK